MSTETQKVDVIAKMIADTVATPITQSIKELSMAILDLLSSDEVARQVCDDYFYQLHIRGITSPGILHVEPMRAALARVGGAACDR